MVKTKVKDPELVESKQRQICRGAMKVFRNKGFHAASIREIAKACKMSLGSLYDYIETKDDILFLVHNMILDQIYDCAEQSLRKFDRTRDQFLNLMRETFSLAFRLKEEMLFIYTETKSLDREQLHEILRRESEFVATLEDLLRKGAKEGVFDCPDPEIYANVVAFFGAVVPLRGWNFLARYSDEKVVDEMVAMLERLVVARNPSAKPDD